MLAIEGKRTVGEVTVYRDDAQWYRFYLVPNAPAFARDAQGRAKLTLFVYSFGQQDRDADPTLPTGGGYLTLQTEFAVTPTQREQVRAQLQSEVDTEYARRRTDPRYAGNPDYAGSAAPQVVLADPTLSSGTVRLRTTQATQLVTGRFAEAPASLVLGSNAAFALDLTAAGADFMRQTLSGEAGGAGMSPIEVEYDLKMWARLPPVEITVTGKADSIHKTLQNLSQTDRDDPCTPAEVETYRERGINSASLVDQGLVDVKTNAGPGVPEEVVTALEQYALKLFDTMIQNRFLEPAEIDSQSLGFGPDDPGAPGERDPGWAAMLYEHKDFGGRTLEVSETMAQMPGDFNDLVSSLKVRPGHRVTLYEHSNFVGSMREITATTPWIGGDFNDVVSSVRVWRPPTTRYKVRETINESHLDLRIHIERSQVVEWDTGAVSAVLQTAFDGADAAAVRDHVVEVTLAEARTLGVVVQTIPEVGKGAVAGVEVEVAYEATDANGVQHSTPDGHTFSAANPGPWKFNPTIIAGERSYKERHRPLYPDGTQGEFTPWALMRSRSLSIAIPDPGPWSLEVSAASLNWELLRTVKVALRTPDPAGGTPLSHTFELTNATPVHRWELALRKPMTAPVEVALTYYLKDEKVLEAPLRQAQPTDALFVVPPPQVDLLDVTLVPAGDWSEVAQCVVTLQYDAGEGVVYDKVARLTGIEQLFQWQVLLRDPTRRAFRMNSLVAYKTGTIDDGAWQTLEGDQAVPIRVTGVPKLPVNVYANLVDFTRTPAVLVTLAYGDERKTLSFTSAEKKSFTPPLRPDGNREFSYQITWMPPDGQPVQGSIVRTTATEVFVPKATLPQTGKLEVLVRGFAVDFAVTPFVDVMLRWKDVDREESTPMPLSLSKEKPNATWTVDIGDRTQRKFTYAIVYNLADGTRVPGKSGETDDPVISVTRYQPTPG
ncbi:MAG: beta/gamma crystallin family protein [Nannocystaceae bacterium]|nr:beta/gamma crystallin family protein [Nannocystaceae bacterium]